MILITGATGTSGWEVAIQLAATGQTVRALVRNPEKAIALKDLGIEVVSGNLDQPETLDKAFEDIDRAFLLPANTLQQVKQETNFIEAAKRAGIKHLVKYSARGSAFDAAAQVARWHAQTEKLVEESGIAYTHIRPIFFMQNILGFAQSIATEGTFALPLGDANVAITDIRDIAAVVVATLTEPGHEGKTYSPTGPEALSMTEVAETLSGVLGKPVTYLPETPENFKASLVQSGLPEWYADDLVQLNLYNASPEGAMITSVVQEVAKKEPIPFAQFANEYAHVFQGN